MSVQPTAWGMYWPTQRPFELIKVTAGDMTVASLAFGWTLGFGYFTVCNAIRETRRSRRISTYVVLIWSEVLVCSIFSVVCFLYLTRDIPPSFWFFFSILTCWALQVQFLLQIIVNRICILMSNKSQRRTLRWSVAALITAINISVYCIWIPARLQISEKYIHINVWWDRTEKSLYLLVDALLNYYFIHTVKQRLIVHGGLKKYAKLVKFNSYIIWVSLSMDVLIIAMMSLKNDFVYMQFHPVAYIVKLNIEMSMSNLIVKVAKDTGIRVSEDSDNPFTKHVETVEVQVHRQEITFRDAGDIEMAKTSRPDDDNAPFSTTTPVELQMHRQGSRDHTSEISLFDDARATCSEPDDEL